MASEGASGNGAPSAGTIPRYDVKRMMMDIQAESRSWKNLSEQEVEALLGVAGVQAVQAAEGQALLGPEEAATHVGLLLTGEAHCEDTARAAPARHYAVVPGMCFGEVELVAGAAATSGGGSSLSVTASSHGTACVKFPIQGLHALSEGQPAVFRKAMSIFSKAAVRRLHAAFAALMPHEAFGEKAKAVPQAEVYKMLAAAGLLQHLGYSLSPADLQALARTVTIADHRPAEVLYRLGARAESLCFLLTGEVQLLPRGDLKERPTIQEGAPLVKRAAGQVVGEGALLESLWGEAAPLRHCNVVSVEETRVAVLSYRRFRQLQRSFPLLALKLLAYFAQVSVREVEGPSAAAGEASSAPRGEALLMKMVQEFEKGYHNWALIDSKPSEEMREALERVLGPLSDQKAMDLPPAPQKAQVPAEPTPAEAGEEVVADQQPTDAGGEAPAEAKSAEAGEEAPAEAKPGDTGGEAPAEAKTAEAGEEAPADPKAAEGAEVEAGQAGGGPPAPGSPASGSPPIGGVAEDRDVPAQALSLAAGGPEDLTFQHWVDVIMKCQRQSQFFCGFDLPEVEVLLRHAVVEHAEDGRDVMAKGNRHRCVGLVLSGRAAVYVDGIAAPEGHEQGEGPDADIEKVGEMAPGDFVGEVALFDRWEYSGEAVVSIGASDVAYWSTEQLVLLGVNHPATALKLLAACGLAGLSQLRLARPAAKEDDAVYVGCSILDMVENLRMAQKIAIQTNTELAAAQAKAGEEGTETKAGMPVKQVSEVLSALSPPDLDSLATVGTLMKCKAGGYLTRMFADAAGYYIVISGTVSINYLGQTIGVKGAGQVVGEHGLTVPHHPRAVDPKKFEEEKHTTALLGSARGAHASLGLDQAASSLPMVGVHPYAAVANEDTSVIYVTADEFQSLMDEFPLLGFKVYMVLAEATAVHGLQAAAAAAGTRGGPRAKSEALVDLLERDGRKSKQALVEDLKKGATKSRAVGQYVGHTLSDYLGHHGDDTVARVQAAGGAVTTPASSAPFRDLQADLQALKAEVGFATGALAEPGGPTLCLVPGEQLLDIATTLRRAAEELAAQAHLVESTRRQMAALKESRNTSPHKDAAQAADAAQRANPAQPSLRPPSTPREAYYETEEEQRLSGLLELAMDRLVHTESMFGSLVQPMAWDGSEKYRALYGEINRRRRLKETEEKQKAWKEKNLRYLRETPNEGVPGVPLTEEQRQSKTLTKAKENQQPLHGWRENHAAIGLTGGKFYMAIGDVKRGGQHPSGAQTERGRPVSASPRMRIRGFHKFANHHHPNMNIPPPQITPRAIPLPQNPVPLVHPQSDQPGERPLEPLPGYPNGGEPPRPSPRGAPGSYRVAGDAIPTAPTTHEDEPNGMHTQFPQRSDYGNKTSASINSKMQRPIHGVTGTSLRSSSDAANPPESPRTAKVRHYHTGAKPANISPWESDSPTALPQTKYLTPQEMRGVQQNAPKVRHSQPVDPSMGRYIS